MPLESYLLQIPIGDLLILSIPLIRPASRRTVLADLLIRAPMCHIAHITIAYYLWITALKRRSLIDLLNILPVFRSPTNASSIVNLSMATIIILVVIYARLVHLSWDGT